MLFSITAAVGFIALSGVAVLNGLVMITYFNQLREQGKSVRDSVIEGSMTLAIVGILFFKENASAPRLLGIVLALVGLFLLRAGN